MENKKRISINILSQIVVFFVGLGVSFVLTPFITAKLGKEVYGFVGMAYQVTSYITLFTIAFTSMHNVFVATEYHKGNIAEANKYFASVTIIDTFLSVILIIPLFCVVLFLEKILDVPSDSLYDIKALWAFIFALFLVNLANGTYAVGNYIKNRLELNAIRNLISNAIRGILLLSFYIFFVPKVWYVGFASFISTIYIVLTNRQYLKKLTPDISVKISSFDIQAVKKLFGVGIWNTVNSLTYILNSGLDLVISNLYIGALGMSLLSYAQTIPTQVYNLISAIFGAFNPELNRLYAEKKTELLLLELKNAMKIGGVICSVPIIGIVTFGPDFYRLWLPSLSENEIVTIQILSILILMPTLFDMYITPIHSMTTITKKIKIPMIVSLIVAVLNIIIELIVLNTTNLGIFAIEIVTAVLLTLQAVLFKPIYVAHILEISPVLFYKTLVRGMLSSGIVLTFFVGVKQLYVIDSWGKLFLTAIVLGAIGYIISMFTLLNKQERKRILSFIKRKIGSKK